MFICLDGSAKYQLCKLFFGSDKYFSDVMCQEVFEKSIWRCLMFVCLTNVTTTRATQSCSVCYTGFQYRTDSVNTTCIVHESNLQQHAILATGSAVI